MADEAVALVGGVAEHVEAGRLEEVAGDAPVVGVGLAADEAEVDEAVDEASDGGGGDAEVVRDLAGGGTG